MKHFVKRISPLFLTFALVLLTMFGATVPVMAEGNAAVQDEQLIAYAQGLTDQVTALSDEDIQSYIDSGNEVTVNLMNRWLEVKEKLGAKSEDQSKAGNAAVTKDGNTYMVSCPVALEKGTVEFVCYVDGTSLSLTDVQIVEQVKETLGSNLQKAGLNTLMGLGTVFFVLVFLSLLISMFKFIPTGDKKAKEKEAAQKAAPVAHAVAVPAEEELMDDTELIAVITAAIAAAEGSTGTDGFVVRSIRKARRSR